MHREIQAKWPMRAVLAGRFSAIRQIPSNFQRHSVWGIENRLHWVLDVDMNEDRARNRCDNGPQNLAILKHMTINTLNAEPSKIPLRRKMKKADRSDAFLRTLLVAI